MNLAIEDEFHTLLVESDSLLAISKISSANTLLWDGVGLILDIVDLVSSCIDFNFVHVKKLANRLTHNLIKLNCEVRPKKICPIFANFLIPI